MREPRVAPAALPTCEDVRRAAVRLRGVAHRTPVVTSRTLDERCGARVFLKCESFQRAGAFKFRGAFNAVQSLSARERRRGVLTYSSGNHAQAIALAGKLLEVRITVVMPENAPAAKLAATRGYGAEVVLYDPEQQSREELGERLREESGAVLIPPYDHPAVIAGQGTAAFELLEEIGPLDCVLVPCGGGGLLSGTALAARALAPGCRVVGVEPARADDAARSFSSGTLQRVTNPQTIADGLRTPSLGRFTFPLVRAHVDEFRTVSEQEIVEAMRFLWSRLKLVVEPSGAVGAAPLIARPGPEHWGERIGVIISGGNVDMGTALRLLTAD
jgi:threo-3-hydroxy-L-aspartate ammonia-lyase